MSNETACGRAHLNAANPCAVSEDGRRHREYLGGAPVQEEIDALPEHGFTYHAGAG
jgi:hypothetical protein